MRATNIGGRDTCYLCTAPFLLIEENFCPLVFGQILSRDYMG